MGKRKLLSNGLGKSDVGAKIIIWILFAVLVFYVLSMVFLLGWGLLTSLKSDLDYNVNGNVLGLPTIDPEGSFYDSSAQFLKLQNYVDFFEKFRIDETMPSYIILGHKEVVPYVNVGFWEMLFNSIWYSLGGAVVQTIAIAVMAYMCAKYKFKFSKIIYTIVIIVMALPIVGAYPGEVSLLRGLGMYNTWWGNLIQKFGFIGMYFLVFYEHFDGMSDTYRDAASIDGASQWTIMTRIYMPMALKMAASIILVRFIFFWNDYTGIRLYLLSYPTLSYGAFYIMTAKPQGTPLMIAGCMLLAIPVLVLFIALQNKIIGSMTMGGLKE